MSDRHSRDRVLTERVSAPHGPYMRRLLILVTLLQASPTTAEMGGVEFMRLCKRDPGPCAGIIREQLEGWPKRILDPAKLKQGRIEHLACPPHVADAALADMFVGQAEKHEIRVQGKSVHKAIEEVFIRGFPECASSRDS